MTGKDPVDLTRRRFVQGLGIGGLIASTGLDAASLLRATPRPSGPQTLRGTDFRLEIDQEPVNVTGSPAIATAINGSVPAPVLRWREGDEVTLRVTNRLPVSSSIHGIILPARMDGTGNMRRYMWSIDGIKFADAESWRAAAR